MKRFFVVVFLCFIGVSAKAQGVNPQSGNYTIQPSDIGQTVYETGVLATITLPSPVGFPAGSIKIINGNGARAQSLMNFPADYIAGCGAQCLEPNQDTEIAAIGGVWVPLHLPGLWNANGLLFYADPSGSDTANDGLSASSPFQHIQYTHDLTKHWVINSGGLQLLCSAVYNENLIISTQPTGYHSFFIFGNTSNPLACVIAGPDATQPSILATDYGTLVMSGVLVGGGSHGIEADQHATVDIFNAALGSCGPGTSGPTFPLYAAAQGKINLTGSMYWNNAANCSGLAGTQGGSAEIDLTGNAVTLNTSAINLGGNGIFNLQGGTIKGPWSFVNAIGSGIDYSVQFGGILFQAGSTYPTGAGPGSNPSGYVH